MFHQGQELGRRGIHSIAVRLGSRCRSRVDDKGRALREANLVLLGPQSVALQVRQQQPMADKAPDKGLDANSSKK